MRFIITDGENNIIFYSIFFDYFCGEIMTFIRKITIALSCILVLTFSAKTQGFWTPVDTLNKTRFYTGLAFGAAGYTAMAVGLYHAWYKQYDQERFHFFNDLHEWNQMDKAGHMHTAYLQGLLIYKGSRWAGKKKSAAIWTGVVASTVFQSTIEVMDGFSSQWGFSVSDIAANIIGTSTFAMQQHFWNDQRITLKVSSIPINYPDGIILSDQHNVFTSLSSRAKHLYGTNYMERFLKDYNAQSYWASFNIHSFLPEGNRWPQWLNVAIGYGAENMYGGFDNQWNQDGATFVLDPIKYPRYRQFYIGFDLDLPKLHPKNDFLKTLFSAFNIFKIPSPALEINTRGQVLFHFFR